MKDKTRSDLVLFPSLDYFRKAMRNRNKPFSTQLVIFLSSCLLCMNFQCDDCEETSSDTYLYSVEPSTSSNIFQVGDTLTLSVRIGTLMPLENSGAYLDYSDGHLFYRTTVFEVLENDHNSVRAVDKFDYLRIHGSTLVMGPSQSQIEVNNFCTSDSCLMVFSMVPKETGYFGIFPTNALFGRPEFCESFLFKSTGVRNDRGNGHELLQEIGLNSIRVDNRFFNESEVDSLLYFFKVID